MLSCSFISSNGSSKSNHALKKALAAGRGLNVDLRAAYNAVNGIQDTCAGATNSGNVKLGSPSPAPAPSSIKFADLPVSVRHTRAAPRPITPYPPSIEVVMASAYNDNGIEPSAAILRSPRPKKGFQPMTL